MGFGTLELVLIFAIMLVVLGPERMAEVARKIGHFVGYARRMSRNFQVQLEDELEMKKIRDSLPNRVDLKKGLGVDKLEAQINNLSDPITPASSAKAAATTAAVANTASDTPEAPQDTSVAAAPEESPAPASIAATTPPAADTVTSKDAAQQ
ncbi:MAG: twin-arginine translocase TatA/TatE family subunit [Pseudomonadota bacterium]